MADIIYERGLVLSAQPSGEADKRFSILTDNSEKIRAVARGSAKISSKLGMHLLVGDEVSVGLVEGRSVLVLVSAEKINRFANQDNYLKLNFLMKVCALVDNFFIEHDNHEGLFDFILGVLKSLAELEEKKIKQLYIFAVLGILRFAGFEIQLQNCVECEKPGEFFSVSLGGVVCAEHSQKYDIKLSNQEKSFLMQQKSDPAFQDDFSESESDKMQALVDDYSEKRLSELRGFKV